MLVIILIFTNAAFGQTVPQVPPPEGLAPVSDAQVQQEPSQFQPQGGVQNPTPSPSPRTAASGRVTLDSCGAVVSRLSALILLEIITEFVFSIFRFLINTERLDWDFQKFALFRLAWTFFPVIPFNFSALWWGTGPKGVCLRDYSSIKVLFTTLLFYTMYSALDAALMIVQSREEEDSDYDSYDYGSEYSRRNWRRRRRRDDSDSVTGTASADDGSEPKLIEKIFPFLAK